MKKISLFLFFSYLSFAAFSKTKLADSIVVNGQIILIVSNSPLDSLSEIRSQLDGYRSTDCADCACEFEAQWKIIDKNVMLVAIKSCPNAAKTLVADLGKLFPSKFKDGMVNADWITGELWITNGTPVNWTCFFCPLYQSETCITIVKGLMTAMKTFEYRDNTVGAPAPGLIRDAKRNEIIQNLKRYRLRNLPDKPKDLQIFFKTNTQGKPTNIHVLDVHTTTAYLIDPSWQKAISKTLNQFKWPVYYARNKQCDVNFSVRLTIAKLPLGPVY